MADYIEIPQANLRNIPIFSDEPNEDLLQEIKQHVRETREPHSWRGHSHTKPEQGALVVYCDEFDVPAPDTVPRVAPCPCCNPHYPQYKNKGKIAWFPDESVIRLIGPQCFKAINEGAHQAALVELRRKQKVRSELATIRRHGPSIDALLKMVDEVSPIAAALDVFLQDLNRALDNELALPLWRVARGGILSVSEERNVPYRKPDGVIEVRREVVPVHFASIAGYGMFDRSGPIAAQKKLGPLRSGLADISRRLIEVGVPERLTDAERTDFAEKLPRARVLLAEALSNAREKQEFLTSDAIETLGRWGRHPTAPYRFSMERKRGAVVLSSASQRSSSPVTVAIGSDAAKALPELPPINEE
ncbi:hypothetical protein [Ferirhizobium litorale]|uniref:Uncharacterized protein n=1 Tax=Ferirhizobium litorale TaxID=2927786 RepID=A0AAE3U682_9HYPH|nr:hypothetical protein [Fererhizobium litorale]MDI7925243.1 hypothetical protein [Fererhizobium litorale]